MTTYVLSVSYALDGEVSLNSLNIAEPRDGINNSHLEVDLKLRFQKVKGEDLSSEEIKNYKNYSVIQGYDYVFDFGAYAATYVDYQLTIPEVYVSYGSGSNLFALGRKMPKTKLFIDEMFYLGVDQAFQRMNPFQPEDQGRLAFSYVLTTDSVIIEAFVSPLSIPDQGANFDFDNGNVTSSNPWASLPPSRLVVDGTGEFNLNYDITNDGVPELLSQLQYGASFSAVSELLKVDAFYFNKSSKQLGFELDPLLDPDQVSEVDVSAKPFFVREHIFGVQLKSKWLDGFEVTNGFYGLLVDSNDVDSDIEFQTELNDYFFVSTAFHLTFDWAKLMIAHLYQSDRPFELNSEVIYIDSNRFLHGSAIKLMLSDLKYKNWEFYSDVLFATQEEGLSAIFNVSYNLNSKLKLTSQLHLIQNLRNDSNFASRLSETNFFRFSSLDNFRLGVSYVF